jgi:hypothetical protein
MAHRLIKNKDFAGKTVARVDAKAVNMIRFYFTDGTAIAIETEGFGHGIVGMVACEVCVEKPKRVKTCIKGCALT